MPKKQFSVLQISGIEDDIVNVLIIAFKRAETKAQQLRELFVYIKNLVGLKTLICGLQVRYCNMSIISKYLL
jgi:hypothetical protein